MARKAISKSLRFEIFKRDGFTCVYCGATAVQSVLHVDHVIAVANGGTNEPENLVTSCRNCNLGKGKRPLDEKRLTPRPNAKDVAEQAEQIQAYMAAQREMSVAREAVIEELACEWERRIGYIPSNFRSRMARHLRDFDYSQLIDALHIASSKNLGVADSWRYYHGILRNWRNDGYRTNYPVRSE